MSRKKYDLFYFLFFKVSRTAFEALATNREEIKRPYAGINLNTKNAVIPAMLPKVNPVTPHPEVRHSGCNGVKPLASPRPDVLGSRINLLGKQYISQGLLSSRYSTLCSR